MNLETIAVPHRVAILSDIESHLRLAEAVHERAISPDDESLWREGYIGKPLVLAARQVNLYVEPR